MFFSNLRGVLTWGKRCRFKGASFVKITKVQVFYANPAPISCEVTCTFKGAGLQSPRYSFQGRMCGNMLCKCVRVGVGVKLELLTMNSERTSTDTFFDGFALENENTEVLDNSFDTDQSGHGSERSVGSKQHFEPSVHQISLPYDFYSLDVGSIYDLFEKDKKKYNGGLCWLCFHKIAWGCHF